VGFVPLPTLRLLVLSGGYLLRHYFMYAAAYERPYPAVNSVQQHSQAPVEELLIQRHEV
jgi:hypothetical protein